MQYDVLREIGNIGAGNATTALSQMINAKIDMKVPNVELLEFKELSDIVGGAENLVVGILFTLEGQIDGMMMFMMDVDASRHLVNLLLGNTDENTSSEFTEMELSALNEIGNIIAGAYLSSLATLTNIVITSSVPYMAIDMAGAILSVPAIEFGKIGDKALLIETEFGDEIREVNGYFILIPTINSYGKILSSLGL
ncbi:chemotaxis protein CheC [Lachnospiraceae bacterium MD1]|uniref:Chemotaxis protein CheC n=2 Tax=Variimorphobacter saccharofermentans TaxID=2755051 RepID=A0A839JZG6_9FIRM|nr:chemotaxis protein CheC [Variimorphobacter saccharofermentans]